MEQITCICEFVNPIFSSKNMPVDNGYRALSFRYIDGNHPDLKKGNLFSAFGYYLTEIPYAKYTLKGYWVDTKYGKQLKVEHFSEEISSNKDGIIAYLKSSINGIGPKTAERIYSVYGTNTLEILEKEPEKLLKVRGVTKKSLEKIVLSYQMNAGARDIITLLAPHNVSIPQCMKILEVFKGNALDIIKSNPYKLMQIKGIAFPTCDRLAVSMGFDLSSKERIRAAIIHAIILEEQKGHCATDADTLKKNLTKLLTGVSIPVKILEENIKDMAANKELVYANHLFCRKETYAAEWDIAKRIIRLSFSMSNMIDSLEEKIDAWEKKNNITLHKEQRKAVSTALSHGFSVITGGPGRGKTTIAKCIVDIRKQYGKNKTVCLLSPTGRAAKNLAESTNSEASTIHSRLMITNDIAFEADVISDATIIIDETSMLDIWTAATLLKAIDDGCQVVFVGDIDQLPSVGAGAVLRDIIASKTVPVVELTKIYRQKGNDNLIVPNADKIKNGDVNLTFDNKTFILYPTDDFKTSARYMIALYKTKVSQYGKDEVICLTPHHHADTYSSVDNMNRYLQEVINHPPGNIPEIIYKKQTFRIGDLVMQIKNFGDVANGEIGVITKIITKDDVKTVIVTFDNMDVEYQGNDLDMLELAYATSIHKSQGSEYKCVILNLLTGHGCMLKRNLLYTAVTRAKVECNLVSNMDALTKAIQNEDTNKRITLLCPKLIQFKKLEESKNPFVKKPA